MFPVRSVFEKFGLSLTHVDHELSPIAPKKTADDPATIPDVETSPPANKRLKSAVVDLGKKVGHGTAPPSSKTTNADTRSVTSHAKTSGTHKSDSASVRGATTGGVSSSKKSGGGDRSDGSGQPAKPSSVIAPAGKTAAATGDKSTSAHKHGSTRNPESKEPGSGDRAKGRPSANAGGASASGTKTSADATVEPAGASTETPTAPEVVSTRRLKLSELDELEHRRFINYAARVGLDIVDK
jgi:hypothetical protein